MLRWERHITPWDVYEEISKTLPFVTYWDVFDAMEEGVRQGIFVVKGSDPFGKKKDGKGAY
ncbi:MAG: hypothetical protein GXO43_01280 [Crenarchaeota archaeon]|nr:hypothetical protein [Thermoproteota archaeon]